MRKALLFLAIAFPLAAQVSVSPTATARRVAKGASDPAACNAGDIFFNTATANLKTCTATNTWTVMVPQVPVTTAATSPSSPTATGFIVNSTGGALTVTLPAITSATVGMQICARNAPAATGAITFDAATGVYIDKEGTSGASGGTLASSGALGDAACVVAISTTVWQAYTSLGTWTAGS